MVPELVLGALWTGLRWSAMVPGLVWDGLWWPSHWLNVNVRIMESIFK